MILKENEAVDATCEITDVSWVHVTLKFTTWREEGANDVYWIVDEVKKLKDKLCRVWIKNHNIKAILASVKLFVVANLVVQC